ncbi:hypothetical protein [Pelosinus baikalensis]|uniref:Uncharacterized protein n=1 Tax=Pelosinus baikalensis TaxID=2892015 RepID=A0ABS8I1E6_9FIRM|nr:hypothetical protein [Pelosinus baikalensis]MCC5468533.1 hypothetical protein [Pelosinus baikalensis]
MSVTSSTEKCKVGRQFITYVRIHEPAEDDKERKINALKIALKSNPPVKDENLEAG